MRKYFKIIWKMTETFRAKYFSIIALMGLAVFLRYASQLVNMVVIDALNNKEIVDPLSNFLNNFFGGRDFILAHLWVMSLSILGIAVSSFVINVARNIMRGYIESKMGEKNQMKLFKHVERLPYPVIKKMKNGDILQTCTHDEEVLRRFIVHDVTQICFSLFNVIIAIIIISLISWKMALVSTIILPLMFLYSYFGIKEVRKRYNDVDNTEAKITAEIEENISAVRVVKAYNNENFEIEKFENSLGKYEHFFRRWNRRANLFYTATDIICFTQIVLTLVMGIYFFTTKDISLGALTVCIEYTSMLVWPIRNTGLILSNLAKSLVSMDRMNKILLVPQEDIESGDKSTLQGNIEFKDVSFAYDDSDKDFLEHINLTIKKGETIAVMGKTGSGKSTIAHLLTRLYDCTEGQILLDGIDIKERSKKAVRQNVATVLQEPYLFSKSVISNIRLAYPKATENEIYEATRIACVDQAITSFKDGYDTEVGERGVSLSGGQKQRIAIARTVITKAPILIFDDSLSAVDTETDINIRKGLKERSKGTTTIIITHRIATAKDADRILVLDNGHIEAIGTHEELIKIPGLYQRVNDIQSRIN